MTDGLTGSEAALLGFVNCSFIVLLLAASEPGNQSLTRRRGERGERERWVGGGGAAGGGGVSAPRTAPASGLWAAGRNSWTRLHTASLRSTDRAEPAPRDPRENRLSVFLLLLLRADCCVLWPRRGLQPRLTAAPLRLTSAGSSSCCWRPRCCGVFGEGGAEEQSSLLLCSDYFWCRAPACDMCVCTPPLAARVCLQARERMFLRDAEVV